MTFWHFEIQFQLFTAIIFKIVQKNIRGKLIHKKKWIGSIYFKIIADILLFMMSSAHNPSFYGFANEQNYQNPIKVRLSFTNFHLTFGTPFIVMTQCLLINHEWRPCAHPIHSYVRHYVICTLPWRHFFLDNDKYYVNWVTTFCAMNKSLYQLYKEWVE